MEYDTVFVYANGGRTGDILVSRRRLRSGMIQGKKIVVVMPAYNAEKTLRQTYEELPHEYVDAVILVDDASVDHTTAVARELGITTIIHAANRGYGANQKTCYREALRLGADIVVMVHPDYQYSPRLVLSLAAMITSGHYDVVLGSRILGGGSLAGGMPFYKYLANRFLTLVENMILGIKVSEYHTGFRAFSAKALSTLPLEENSNDFVFDNEMLAQAAFFGFSIGELSCPTKYFKEASSINFSRSVTYGFGVLATTFKYLIQRSGFFHFRIFNSHGKRLEPGDYQSRDSNFASQ